MICWLCAISCAYWKFFLTLFVIQGVIGVLLFEWGWASAKRQLEGEEELLAQFPSYRRPDMHKWRKWKFYPGNFVMCVPRILTVVGWFAFVGFGLKLLFLGQ